MSSVAKGSWGERRASVVRKIVVQGRPWLSETWSAVVLFVLGEGHRGSRSELSRAGYREFLFRRAALEIGPDWRKTRRL